MPLRYQLAAALIALNIVATGALATYAYRASKDSLEDQAAHAVAVAAKARDLALGRLLDQRHDRMRAFLGSVEMLCGERTASGGFGWEKECVRTALGGFQMAERVSAADLRYGRRHLATRGTWTEVAPMFSAGQLASIANGAGSHDYIMRAARGRLTLRVRLLLDDVDAIFQDRSGVEAHGEVFLTDRNGFLLTGAQTSQAVRRPLVLTAALRPCLTGAAGHVHAPDYRGIDTISEFLPVPALGGGCIVANLQHADALVPIQRLGRQFALASVDFILVGAILSLFVARKAIAPVDLLVDSARALEAGHFDRPVPISGPSEIRQLGRALSSMAKSVRDLVLREQEARVEAEAASRTKDEFLAMLSHELRTPLNAILGWTSIISNHRGDETLADRALATIERSARTQARLIDELLDVSRIVNRQLRLHIVPGVSLGGVIDAALEVIRPSGAAKRLEIVTRAEPKALTVPADAGRLQQVVGNLLSNAVRFTPEGGRIEITLSAADGFAEIRVSDNGIGISDQFLPHVFERFRQADGCATRTHGGLGLGLAIVRHLVELHGGTVRAESDGPGLGATFTVRLPSATATAATPEAAAPAFTRPSLKGARVLVVDDDADTREVLRAILEDAGALVAATSSATETRAFLAGAEADLLIADIGMPKEDGYSLIRSVRAVASTSVSQLPAIALSAHARPEDVEKALASGFQLHLAKPVDSSRLLSAVTSALDGTWMN